MTVAVFCLGSCAEFVYVPSTVLHVVAVRDGVRKLLLAGVMLRSISRLEVSTVCDAEEALTGMRLASRRLCLSLEASYAVAGHVLTLLRKFAMPSNGRRHSVWRGSRLWLGASARPSFTPETRPEAGHHQHHAPTRCISLLRIIEAPGFYSACSGDDRACGRGAVMVFGPSSRLPGDSQHQNLIVRSQSHAPPPSKHPPPPHRATFYCFKIARLLQSRPSLPTASMHWCCKHACGVVAVPRTPQLSPARPHRTPPPLPATTSNCWRS